MSSNCDVLVVGAGPVGLFLACDLTRRDLDVRVVDKNDGPTDLSKAIGIHARSLELFQDLGIIERAIERGQIENGALFYSADHFLADIRLDKLDAPYPMLLDLEQAQTERLLMERLAELGGRDERQTELVGFVQDDEGVTATLKTSSGEETCRARFMVGCDGAHSAVRHGLGSDFDREAFPGNMLLADVKRDWELPPTASWSKSATPPG